MGLRMTLEQLKKQIQNEASSQRKHALDETKKQANAIVETAKSQANALLEKAKWDAEKEAKTKYTQVSAARLKAKKMQAEAQDVLVKDQLEKLKHALQSFVNKPAYDTVLKNLVEQSLEKIGPGAMIHVRKKDLSKVKKKGVRVQEMDCWGGCVASTPDGRIRVNNTLESLFEENQEKLRQKVFEEM
jgi:V/A-type H+/Na+-transporting ATPase subunit E